MATQRNVSAQTPRHTIAIAEGKLTISGDGEALTDGETLLLLEILLIWQYGLEVITPNDLED